jgi:N-acyl-D-aspartate/D-glutamate deacylase
MKYTIDMAHKAGFKEHNGMLYVTTINDDCAKELKAFEALVRADEREACAKVCIDLAHKWTRVVYWGQQTEYHECARAIRARGEAK